MEGGDALTVEQSLGCTLLSSFERGICPRTRPPPVSQYNHVLSHGKGVSCHPSPAEPGSWEPSQELKTWSGSVSTLLAVFCLGAVPNCWLIETTLASHTSFPLWLFSFCLQSKARRWGGFFPICIGLFSVFSHWTKAASLHNGSKPVCQW